VKKIKAHCLARDCEGEGEDEVPVLGGEDNNEAVPASRRQVEIVCEMKPRCGGWVMMKKPGAID
jgi:hypothetical protein